MNSEEVEITYPENGTEAETPVIFLFGWAGAEDKEMKKYSQMYSKNGYISVRYTAPWNYIFINNEKVPEAAEKLFQLITEQDPKIRDQNRVFHVFSNLGCAVYQFFSQELSKNGTLEESFKGVIFDSCPGDRRLKSFFNSMGFVLGGNVLRRKMIPVFYFIYLIGKSIYRGITGLDDNFIFWWDYLKEKDPLQMPHLYIYSVADECVDSSDIKEMIKYRKQNGTQVTEKEFLDSKHVSHYDKYPEEYENAVLDFLNNL